MTTKIENARRFTFVRVTHSVDMCWNWTQNDQTTILVLLRDCESALRASFGLKPETALQFHVGPNNDVIAADRLLKLYDVLKLYDEYALLSTAGSDTIFVFVETGAGDTCPAVGAGDKKKKRKHVASSDAKQNDHIRRYRGLDGAADLAHGASQFPSPLGNADVRECTARYNEERILIKQITRGTGTIRLVERIV